MNLKKISVTIVLFVVLLSFGIRLVQLGSLPQILNRDEAALAYNALLLTDTGKDEWGRSWPLVLESFGDYKLPGYPILLAGLFQIFEPSDLLVRIPSVVASVSLILLAYAFTQVAGWRRQWSLIAALSIASTPVFFFYARIGFEAMVGLALLLTALLLLYAPVQTFFRKRFVQDLVAVLFWLTAAITYNTPLLLIPFFVPVIIVGRKAKNWKNWIVPVLAISLVFGGLLSPQSNLTTQKSSITLFGDETHRELANTRYNSYTGLIQKTWGNQYVYLVTEMFKNAVAEFSPQFLLTRGGPHPLHQLPGNGHLTLTLYLFGILGYMYALGKVIGVLKKTKPLKHLQKKEYQTEILLLVTTSISLAPAVVTVDAPHATRSLLFFFCMVLASVYAATKLKKNIGVLFIVVTVLLFAQYVNEYFTEYPNHQPGLLQVGYQEVIQSVDASTEGPVAVVDPDGYQYILTAWYLRMDPDTFFTTNIKQLPNQIGFRYGQQVGRYHFIGQLNDRSEEEKTVVTWDGGKWQVYQY
ncbi:MAG: glycosyltransferase family 39 protein [Pseudomonadales bacterium]|nr:glycosyltransferase family 39 protein [Candidatus Woesebacteria bacterium]MCB9800814.1 glycosyltransferase family 39 protein [Pseudomonadales bacterium]